MKLSLIFALSLVLLWALGLLGERSVEGFATVLLAAAFTTLLSAVERHSCQY